MIFTGHAPTPLDKQGRITIPSKHRAMLDPQRDGNAFYTVPWRERRLLLFTEAAFTKLTLARGTHLAPSEDEESGEPDYFGMAERCELDTSHRITLPKYQLDLTGLTGNLTLVGAGQRLELWRTEEWEAGMKERFARMPAAMRRLDARSEQARFGQARGE